jgi:chorismate-pyruvate lyase
MAKCFKVCNKKIKIKKDKENEKQKANKQKNKTNNNKQQTNQVYIRVIILTNDEVPLLRCNDLYFLTQI